MSSCGWRSVWHTGAPRRTHRRVPKHLTFTGQQSGIDRFVSALHQPRVVVADRATHGAMRAKSAYFSYPDGHDLELCEPLAYI